VVESLDVAVRNKIGITDHDEASLQRRMAWFGELLRPLAGHSEGDGAAPIALRIHGELLPGVICDRPAVTRRVHKIARKDVRGASSEGQGNAVRGRKDRLQ